jgi:nicotinamide mononucleotide transporter
MFKNWTNFEKIWLLISAMVSVYIFFTTGHNVLGLTTSLLGLLYVVNVAKGSVWCFLFGALQMVCYAYISYHSKVFGEFALNAFYSLPMQAYGYLQWKKYTNKNDKLEVNVLTKKGKVMLIAAWAALVAGSYYVLHLLGGNTPILDAMATITSVVALFLSVKRYQEQWILWIIVNGLTFTLWTFAVLRGDIHGLPMLGMWGAYFVNSIYGYINWNKLAK